MSIASSTEFLNAGIPNIIPFPTDPDFGKGDFSTDKLDGKTKTSLLFETYVSERKKISNRQKQIYFSPSEYSEFPSSEQGRFDVFFETTRGFKRRENLSEDRLDKFLKYLGERTSSSVGGLVHRTIKKGFPVGIKFNEKNSGEYEKPDLETQCGIIIEVYNANQPVEIYKIDKQGRKYKTILTPKRIIKGRTYDGKTFLNAYALQCRVSDLSNYIFSANVKSIRRVEKNPDKLAN